jgi:transposase
MPDHPNPFRRFIGCDVGKASLVFFELGNDATQTIANRKADIEAFAATLDASCLVVCEATGGHEALLLSGLSAAGIAAHRADARKVKAFIRSFGILGKSDDIDARQLSHYAKERQASLPLWQVPDQNHQKLQALVLARQDMVADRVAWTNRLKAPGAGHAATHFEAVLTCIQNQIAAIEAAIAALIKQTARLRQAGQVLSAIPGIGATTAATLIALMPELGSLDRRKAAALAGVAPHPKRSATAIAYQRTRGGRPQVKRALFLAAMSASKCNPQLRPTFERLIKEGKKPMVALTAVMRKLIVIANAKLRDAIKERPSPI